MEASIDGWAFNVDLQIDHSPRHQNICVGWIVTHVEHAYGSLDLLAITHPHSNSSQLIAVVGCIIINFVNDRVQYKARPANVLPYIATLIHIQHR